MNLDSLYRRLQYDEVITPVVELAISRIGNLGLTTIPVDFGYEDDNYFHPSSDTERTVCESWVARHPEHTLVEPPLSYSQAMSMFMGTMAHHAVQKSLVEMGAIPQEDVELRVWDDVKHISGHTDWLHPYPLHPTGKIPVEFKTSQPDAFNFMNKPLDYYVKQFSVYLDHFGYDYGFVVVMKQSSPYNLKEFKIHKDVGFLEECYARWDYVWDLIQKDTPPPNCCTSKNCPLITLGIRKV